MVAIDAATAADTYRMLLQALLQDYFNTWLRKIVNVSGIIRRSRTRHLAFYTNCA